MDTPISIGSVEGGQSFSDDSVLNPAESLSTDEEPAVASASEEELPLLDDGLVELVVNREDIYRPVFMQDGAVYPSSYDSEEDLQQQEQKVEYELVQEGGEAQQLQEMEYELVEGEQQEYEGDEAQKVEYEDEQEEDQYYEEEEIEEEEVPAGEEFHNLKMFTLRSTPEDNAKRGETLLEKGIFLTPEAYAAYTLTPDTNDDAEWNKLYNLVCKKEKEYKQSKLQKSIKVEEEEATHKRVKVDHPINVLDSVLTNISRSSSIPIVRNEPAAVDLEIAAMAAVGIDTPKKEESQFTQQDHDNFLRISKDSSTATEQEIAFYKNMCKLLKSEQDEFMKQQKEKLIKSNVYALLNIKIRNLVQSWYQLESTRIKNQYPQHYKWFHLLNLPMNTKLAHDVPVLTFKKNLLQTGRLNQCKVNVINSPRRLDLHKKYIDKTDNEKEEEEDGIYYKLKCLNVISQDETIQNLLQNDKVDIVIASDTLCAMIEVLHDISLELILPITVKQDNNGKRILIIDRPLPKERMSAREINQSMYDIIFKSTCLDYKYAEDNLHYNIWSFGDDLNILIRHEIDAELNKKPVCFSTKLDYQVGEDGLEEITTNVERTNNWLKSYLGGHALILEARIDPIKNQLVRVDRKEMKDIMKKWNPMQESEFARHILSKLYNILSQPGNYVLQHQKQDGNFLIYQQQDNADFNLFKKTCFDMPVVDKEERFIPAWWPTKENQVVWTFPPRK